jgi:hypothetical protein
MFGKDKKVVGRQYLDEIGGYIETHKKDAFTKLIFGTLLVLGVIGYMNITKKLTMTMEIPSTIRESGTLKVGYQDANDLYFKVWGQWFVDEYSSLEPKNASKKLTMLLSLVDAEKAVLYRPLFEKKKNHIKTNKITQKYIPTPSSEVILKNKQNGLTIFHSEGLMIEKIGRVEIRKSCKYNIGLSVDNYTLIFGLVSEECKKIGSINE